MNTTFYNMYSWLRRQPRRLIQNRVTAYLSGELPARNAANLFPFNGLDIIRSNMINWRFMVHMTAENGNVGRSHFNELESFINRNPEYFFVFWDSLSRDAFIEEHFLGTKIEQVYKKIPYGVVRSDIFRLCALKIFGGIYIDFKSYFKTPLSEFNFNGISGYLIVFPRLVEDRIQDPNVMQSLKLPVDRHIMNGFLAFSPDHLVVRSAIDEIICQYERGFNFLVGDFKVRVWEFSGPRMITRVLNNIWTDDLGVEIFGFHDSRRLWVQHCRGAWVRKVLDSHYTSLSYLKKVN